MNAWRIAAVVVLGFEALGTIVRIGKPRAPLTPVDALGSIIEWGAIIALVIA